MTESVLTAVYDLAVSPASFDFSAFLVCAESRRRKIGLDTIRVLVLPAESGVGHSANELIDDKSLSWRTHHLLAGIGALLPSLVGLSFTPSRAYAESYLSAVDAKAIFPEGYKVREPLEMHHTGWTVILSHGGENIQYLQASEQARAYARQWIDAHSDGRKPVALTLREAQFHPQRNSKLEAWGAFARDLIDDGYFPILLRDIDTAFCPPSPEFRGTATFNPGVFNVDVRQAFYEECYACAFVANGPGQLCFYDSQVRFIYLPTGEWLRNPSAFARIGIEFGERPPFLNRYQQWVWKEQDPAILRESFADIVERIEADERDGRIEEGRVEIGHGRISISELGERFARWAMRSQHTSPEEARLAQFCCDSAAPSDPRTSFKSRLTLAFATRNVARAIELLEDRDRTEGLDAGEHVQLGMAYEASGLYAEAVPHYRRSLELASGAANVTFRLGTAARGAGDIATARACFEELAHRGAKDPALVHALGSLYEECGELDRALAFYDGMIAKGVHDPAVLKQRALLSLKARAAI